MILPDNPSLLLFGNKRLLLSLFARAGCGESRNGMDVGGGLVLITPPQTERVADNVIASVSITVTFSEAKGSTDSDRQKCALVRLVCNL